MYMTGMISKSSYRKYLFYKPMREPNNTENPKRALDLGTGVVGIVSCQVWVLGIEPGFSPSVSSSSSCEAISPDLLYNVN